MNCFIENYIIKFLFFKNYYHNSDISTKQNDVEHASQTEPLIQDTYNPVNLPQGLYKYIHF